MRTRIDMRTIVDAEVSKEAGEEAVAAVEATLEEIFGDDYVVTTATAQSAI